MSYDIRPGPPTETGHYWVLWQDQWHLARVYAPPQPWRMAPTVSYMAVAGVHDLEAEMPNIRSHARIAEPPEDPR